MFLLFSLEIDEIFGVRIWANFHFGFLSRIKIGLNLNLSHHFTPNLCLEIGIRSGENSSVQEKNQEKINLEWKRANRGFSSLNGMKLVLNILEVEPNLLWYEPIWSF